MKNKILFLLKENLKNRFGYGVPNQPKLGQFYFDQIKDRLEWFEARSASQTGDDLLNIALVYNVGIYGSNDLMVRTYYQLAADQGNVAAQNDLGWCYLEGRFGVEKNQTMAVKYYTMAAEQGYVVAQKNLGWCYKQGHGVQRDIELSKYYYHLAADAGYEIAQNLLGVLYEFQDDLLAGKYFKLAADQGLDAAQENLGNFCCSQYRKGKIEFMSDKRFLNLQLSIKYSQLAMDQGTNRPKYLLGDGEYVVGSRTSCYEVENQCFLVLASRKNNDLLVSELWMIIIRTLLEVNIHRLK